MSKVISFFNHKGGVGKTTLAHNIAWHLANKGKKVLLIDADPQCNLTGLVHGFSDEIEYDLFNDKAYKLSDFLSIYEYLTPRLFTAGSDLENLKKPLFVHSHSQENITLLSGDIRASEYDFEFIDAIRTKSMATKHIPVVFERSIKELSKDYDFTLIDLSPNLGVFNMFNVMSSDYFIVPVFPSFFCLQAIDNLKSVFKQWNTQIDYYRADKFNEMGITARPKFLGLVSQNFRKHNSGDTGVAKSFKEWEEKVNTSAKDLASTLFTYDMAISGTIFKELFKGEDPYCIARISDFNQLKTVSEKHGVPVVGIDRTILSQESIAIPHYEEQITNYKVIFDKIIDGLIKL
ncbi:MAG TPA: AAA family ATPase [Burkholderiales bacterium]|nr:AAA family ATPase [Burkholderiales bacterium]